MIEKYGTYTLYFCPEIGEHIRVPHDGEKRDKILEKIALKQLTLIEVKESERHNNKVRVIQSWGDI